MRDADPLVRVAERANPRRSFLLVSSVLGKHLPVSAARCRLAGIALGLRVVADRRAEPARQALTGGDPQQVQQLIAELEREPADALPDAVVLGFAETATALGEQVASTLDAAWFQTTTRQRSALAQAVAFKESHSHAPEQWVAVPDAGWPTGPLLVVDDELTTGATAARLIGVMHGHQPRDRYVVAALVDGRPDGVGPLERCASRLRTCIEVVSLERRGPQASLPTGWSAGTLPSRLTASLPRAPSLELHVGFPGALQHHGQSRDVRRMLDGAVDHASTQIGALPAGSLALGTGEHLAFAQRCAQRAGALTSSTTRSPALVSLRPGYPIRDGLAFMNPDGDDVAGYAYNLQAGERPAVVVHFQDREHRSRGQHLLDTLHHAGAPSITVVILAD
ncbi:MAG: phosphoribosyltransferase domain-containing protein [Solirubrobacteraceae bacterium]